MFWKLGFFQPFNNSSLFFKVHMCCSFNSWRKANQCCLSIFSFHLSFACYFLFGIRSNALPLYLRPNSNFRDAEWALLTLWWHRIKLFMFCRQIWLGFLWDGPRPSYLGSLHSIILSTDSAFLCFLVSVSKRWRMCLFVCHLPDRSDPGTVWLTALVSTVYIVGPHPVDGMKD